MSLSSEARAIVQSEAFSFVVDKMADKIMADIERCDPRDAEAARALAIRYQVFREFVSRLENLSDDEPLEDWRASQAKKFQ